MAKVVQTPRRAGVSELQALLQDAWRGGRPARRPGTEVGQPQEGAADGTWTAAGSCGSPPSRARPRWPAAAPPSSLGDRQPIRLGYVSPRAVPLFAFGEADTFVIEGAKGAFKDGLAIGGRSHPVEILVRDSRSSPERAGEVARDLITATRST